MTCSPATANSQCLQEGVRYSSSYSSNTSTTLTREDSSGARSTLSVSLSSSYTYNHSETRYTPGNQEPASVYSPPLYKAPSAPAREIQEAQDQTANDKSGAALVLAFIEQRLLADQDEGMSKDDLQNRLNAGYQGFMQGYNEAVSLLESMGLFEGEVKNTVEQMFKQVMHGFADLAEKFELENPANSEALVEDETPATPVAEQHAPDPVLNQNSPQQVFADFLKENLHNQDAETFQTLIEPSQSFYARLDAEESSSRLYSFKLRTTDGDTVTIRSYSDQGTRYQFAQEGNTRYQQFDVAGMDDFRFSVEGELDAGELTAITDLLSQLNDVAELFFEGDVHSAYQQALDVGYNSDEIARFSLNLRQTEYTRLENTYGSVARAETERSHDMQGLGNKVARFSDFMRLLENLREQGERFNFRSQLLAGLADFVGQQRFSHHPQLSKFAPLISELGAALERHPVEKNNEAA